MPRKVVIGTRQHLFLRAVTSDEPGQGHLVAPPGEIADVDFDIAVRSGPGGVELVLTRISEELFRLTFCLPVSGWYSLSLVCRKVALKGSPVVVFGEPGATVAGVCVCRGAGLASAKAGRWVHECVGGLVGGWVGGWVDT